jgi:hypothetical protein
LYLSKFLRFSWHPLNVAPNFKWFTCLNLVPDLFVPITWQTKWNQEKPYASLRLSFLTYKGCSEKFRKTNMKTGGVTQVVGLLLCMREALSSSSSPTKNKYEIACAMSIFLLLELLMKGKASWIPQPWMRSWLFSLATPTAGKSPGSGLCLDGYLAATVTFIGHVPLPTSEQ